MSPLFRSLIFLLLVSGIGTQFAAKKNHPTKTTTKGFERKVGFFQKNKKMVILFTIYTVVLVVVGMLLHYHSQRSNEPKIKVKYLVSLLNFLSVF